MRTKIWYAIGLMSGTSLDGVDIAYVKFTYSLGNEKWKFEIIKAKTFSYSEKWLKILKDAFFYSKKELKELDFSYGEYLANLITDFIKSQQISTIDFIASHGHTIHHKPNEGYTLQIGNGDLIAQMTNVKTIYNFRLQDVLYGGQGAPLVPIGDQLLFSDYDYCLNLGGFANISFEVDNTRIAYDICAVNTVLNHFTNQIDLAYDDEGKIASKGELHKGLLEELNNLPYYKTDKPKSLGFEYVNEILLPLINSFSLEIDTVLHTFIEHISIQIAANINSTGSLLITGGGAFNLYLIERIRKHAKTEIIIPNKTIIDYKEALVFAFLGVLRLENKTNCLQSVTGASKNHSSGVVVEI